LDVLKRIGAAAGEEDHTKTKGEVKMNIAPPSTVYNHERAITPVELHEIVHDMGRDVVNLVNRSHIEPGAFSLEWMGIYVHVIIVFGRTNAETAIMMARLRGAGFDGDIKDLSAEPAPAKKNDEHELVQFLREVWDRSEGKPTQSDKAAFKSLRRKHRV